MTAIEEFSDAIETVISGIVSHILRQPDRLGTDPAAEIRVEMDAAEDMVMILLRLLKHARSCDAAASKGGPAESIRDLLNTMS